tara:strand:+ start:566 stop:754 length:189 start_codon:yes stop_codon:yes gene_type:complete
MNNYKNLKQYINDVFNFELFDLPVYQIGIIKYYYKLGKTKAIKDYITEMVKKDYITEMMKNV